ncbi:hypothetical protein EG329_001029 [Mollisiaceae sp. DMI_Dod_QoI]|nr:hypothetical protein EG329_001029 [Helotiales sp. DMI_Dod_QoI]
MPQQPLPTTNHGLLKISPNQALPNITSLTPLPIPKLRPSYILVKTIAVALNPTDWQTLDEKFKPGTEYSLLGCDASGIVVAVGEDVEKGFRRVSMLREELRVGNDLEPEDGCFAEYIVMKGDLAMHIPPNLSFEEAATLPCGLITVGLGFYRHLELPFPNLLRSPVENQAEKISEEEEEQEPKWILIYGGSSATGTLAIQFAKLSGLKVITTASPRNFELLRGLGAEYLFDYHDPECGAKINALTNNALYLVFDTIATASSASICASAISTLPSSPQKKIYVNLMGIPFPRSDVTNIFFLGYTVRGEAFEIEGERWEAVPEDFELGKRFMGLCENLLREGKIKPHPVKMLEG